MLRDTITDTQLLASLVRIKEAEPRFVDWLRESLNKRQEQLRTAEPVSGIYRLQGGTTVLAKMINQIECAVDDLRTVERAASTKKSS